MSVLDRLAYFPNRRDDVTNHEPARDWPRATIRRASARSPRPCGTASRMSAAIAARCSMRLAISNPNR